MTTKELKNQLDKIVRRAVREGMSPCTVVDVLRDRLEQTEDVNELCYHFGIAFAPSDYKNI